MHFNHLVLFLVSSSIITQSYAASNSVMRHIRQLSSGSRTENRFENLETRLNNIDHKIDDLEKNIRALWDSRKNSLTRRPGLRRSSRSSERQEEANPTETPDSTRTHESPYHLEIPDEFDKYQIQN